ncbi:heavy metal translocating P-type ATPase [Cellulomonas sp.]|uniref:heavy metal translocating P-type ATPase n=1 Tax=Cellulomonas sp. TaxID=40001 RepID=UPI001B241C37|nr:heavy metal translocating P-type ATPase [Cellulomonas sp.]MBO9555046.1 heavy metal translocating P-type ATPase [Cellulomonas sp.]
MTAVRTSGPGSTAVAAPGEAADGRRLVAWLRRRHEALVLGLSLVLLAGGGVAWWAGATALADAAWVVATLLGLLVALATTIDAARHSRPTVDVIAVLALGGALWVGEPLAGAIITLMLATGQVLDERAEARARRELSLLVARAPRTARRLTAGELVEIPVDDVALGDRLLVRTGEVVPVDGRLTCAGTFDESALTGEARPVDRPAGDDVRSGVVSAAGPVEVITTTTAATSTYAGLVRLVEQAQAGSAPFVRSADRWAVLLVPLTLAIAALAWVVSGDPVRAVAVLVVATPCPLLLAAPIALVSGLSRAARLGVVVKGGGALERLADGRVVVFDKTGTLTRGRPTLTDVVPAAGGDPDEALRLAASLDQASAHVLAAPIVTAALARGLVLTMPTDVVETHGQGVAGAVDGRRVRVGRLAWVAGGEPDRWSRQVRRRADLDGSLSVLVEVDGATVAALLLHDPVRPDAPRMVRALRGAGIRRVVLATGDRADVADMVGRIVGVDAVLADCSPADKLRALRAEAAHGPTVMVGDGINDAPALAEANVGVALAARGATASSEAADVVLTVDRVDALGDAILVARRSRRIARQAVGVGMGLSLIAMVAAAAGLLAPAVGAALQEVIDVLAIGIALRAVLPGPLHSVVLSETDRAALAELRDEHHALGPLVERVGQVADALTTEAPDLADARDLLTALETDLLPHERADETLLLPLVARALRSTDAVAALSRTHAEIEHQVARARRLVEGIDDDTRDGAAVAPEDVVELRRTLYGLYAILRLHNAQEDEGAMSLAAP